MEYICDDYVLSLQDVFEFIDYHFKYIPDPKINVLGGNVNKAVEIRFGDYLKFIKKSIDKFKLDKFKINNFDINDSIFFVENRIDDKILFIQYLKDLLKTEKLFPIITQEYQVYINRRFLNKEFKLRNKVLSYVETLIKKYKYDKSTNNFDNFINRFTERTGTLYDEKIKALIKIPNESKYEYDYINVIKKLFYMLPFDTFNYVFYSNSEPMIKNKIIKYFISLYSFTYYIQKLELKETINIKEFKYNCETFENYKNTILVNFRKLENIKLTDIINELYSFANKVNFTFDGDKLNKFNIRKYINQIYFELDDFDKFDKIFETKTSVSNYEAHNVLKKIINKLEKQNNKLKKQNNKLKFENQNNEPNLN